MTIDIEEVAKAIPTGHENAKPLTQMIDVFEHHGWLDGIAYSGKERRAREMIARVGIDYVICNLQDGKGYFRPTKEDKDDLRRWVLQEENRAKNIGKRLQRGKKLLEDFYKERCDEQRIE